MICSCGEDHVVPELVEMLIRKLGVSIAVRTPAGEWLVPRVYIAIHGLDSRDVPKLAERVMSKKGNLRYNRVWLKLAMCRGVLSDPERTEEEIERVLKVTAGEPGETISIEEWDKALVDLYPGKVLLNLAAKKPR